jgi:hypothetical protein
MIRPCEGATPLRSHLNCGIVGAVMCGCGSGAILEALPTPLGSTATLFNPPAFAGPRAIPLIGTFPIAAEPACRPNPPRANEAAGEARTKNNAIATFTEVFDMGKLHCGSLERRMREADVGPQSAGTIKLNFISASSPLSAPRRSRTAPEMGSQDGSPIRR